MNLPAIAAYPNIEAAAVKWPQPEIRDAIADYILSIIENAEPVYQRQDLSQTYKAGYLFGVIQNIHAVINQQKKGR